MVAVRILPVQTAGGQTIYHAVAGAKQSQGHTAGEALDALTAQMAEGEATTLIIVQTLRPDRFFEAGQQQRLAELMERWRVAPDTGAELPAQEQTELEALVEEELPASGRRSAALLDELAG